VRRLAGEGARLLAARRPGEAIVKLAEAWELDSQNVDVAINLGGAYILQGKHKRGIPVLETASLLEPDNAMVWSNLAAAYLGKLPLSTQEQQQKAIDAYERALALDPRAPHVHYNLGLIYLERDEPLRAASHFHGALKTDPSDRDARHWLDRIEEGARADCAPHEG
jgi:protein O-GlcNAc transferase